MALTRIKTGGLTDNSVTDAKVADAITVVASGLSGNTLASGVTASSLTSVGTLTGLSVNGDIALLSANDKISDGTNNILERTAGGYITIGASAWNEIRLNTTGSTDFVLDNSGNVGIGNTVASTINSANNGGRLVIGDGSGNEGMTIYSGNGSGDYGILYFADGTSGASTYQGWLAYLQDVNALTLATSGTEKVRIESDGKVGIGTNDPANFVEILAGDGVGDDIFALRVQNQEATDGRSYGLKVMAGSNSSDTTFELNDHDGSNVLMKVLGNGNTTFAGNLTVNGTGSDVITGDYLYLDAHNNSGAKNLVFRQLDDTWLGQIEFHPTNKGWITTRVNQPLAFGTNNNEMLYLDTAGNLGLGSGSNTNARIVRGFSQNKGLVIETQQPAISFVDTADTNKYYTQAYDNGTMYFYNSASGDINFYSNGAQKFIIQADQSAILGVRSYVVGTSSPTQEIRFQGHHAGFGDGVRTFSRFQSLKINSTGGDVKGGFKIQTNSNANNLIDCVAADNNGFVYMPNLGGGSSQPEVLCWTSSSGSYDIGLGNMLIKNTSSRKFKKNIKECELDSSLIYQLEPKTFLWNDKSVHPNLKDFGMIAEDVAEIIPELATRDGDEIIGIRYQMLSVLLLEELKKLKTKVEALENA